MTLTIIISHVAWIIHHLKWDEKNFKKLCGHWYCHVDYFIGSSNDSWNFRFFLSPGVIRTKWTQTIYHSRCIRCTVTAARTMSICTIILHIAWRRCWCILSCLCWFGDNLQILISTDFDWWNHQIVFLIASNFWCGCHGTQSCVICSSRQSLYIGKLVIVSWMRRIVRNVSRLEWNQTNLVLCFLRQKTMGTNKTPIGFTIVDVPVLRWLLPEPLPCALRTMLGSFTWNDMKII